MVGFEIEPLHSLFGTSKLISTSAGFKGVFSIRNLLIVSSRASIIGCSQLSRALRYRHNCLLLNRSAPPIHSARIVRVAGPVGLLQSKNLYQPVARLTAI